MSLLLGDLRDLIPELPGTDETELRPAGKHDDPGLPTCRAESPPDNSQPD